ncbi:Uma2 family endonuclease [Streptomyces sp. A1136]|uniref:Uma2 family endonuclease n=1 Tax=Streptomyces sp. A1136 TaxID=2563102 RepID=UPI0034D1FB21
MGDPVTGLTKVPDPWSFGGGRRRHGEGVNSRDVLMVVEVVSRTNCLTEIRDKLHDYPRMGVPIYVVVDPGALRLRGYRHSRPMDAQHERPQELPRRLVKRRRDGPCATAEKGPERGKAPHRTR